MPKSRRRIVHLVYCFDTGGLERVLLNCVNRLDHTRYEQHIVALTCLGAFAQFVAPGVTLHQLDKPPGNDLTTHLKLFRLLRRLRPDVLHSYNFATLEYHPVAWLAGVGQRIHAEHGRDIFDPDGTSRKYRLWRLLLGVFVQHFIAVSQDLRDWLVQIGIPARKVLLIYNGIEPAGFRHDGAQGRVPRLIHVARLAAIKDQPTLLHAAALVREQRPDQPFELAMVGDGPERAALEGLCDALAIRDRVVFLGERHDVDDLLARADVFVMSSRAEGVPMTALEAMASSLPVVATAVGGLPEVVTPGTGLLVEAGQPQALADALVHYLDDPAARRRDGSAARERVDQCFSEQLMVARYAACYDGLPLDEVTPCAA